MGRVSIFGKLFNLFYYVYVKHPTFPSGGLAYFALYSAMFIHNESPRSVLVWAFYSLSYFHYFTINNKDKFMGNKERESRLVYRMNTYCIMYVDSATNDSIKVLEVLTLPHYRLDQDIIIDGIMYKVIDTADHIDTEDFSYIISVLVELVDDSELED